MVTEIEGATSGPWTRTSWSPCKRSVPERVGLEDMVKVVVKLENLQVAIEKGSEIKLLYMRDFGRQLCDSMEEGLDFFSLSVIRPKAAGVYVIQITQRTAAIRCPLSIHKTERRLYNLEKIP